MSRQGLEWYARLIDARLSESDTQRWERLVADGMRYDAATKLVVASRDDAGGEQLSIDGKEA